jgi:hypothetical protein
VKILLRGFDIEIGRNNVWLRSIWTDWEYFENEMTVLVKNTAQVMGCDKFSFVMFIFIQSVAYNMQPKYQTCINTERNT